MECSPRRLETGRRGQLPQQPDALRSCFAMVDGARVHYWRAGDGPAVVLVHGLVANGLSWEQNVAALANLRTVYALDLPNMGRTERVSGVDAGLAATAAWLARFLDAVGVDEADLVGSSHGGAVCLMLAAADPGRVRSLVLFAPANPFCQLPRPLIRFYNSRLGAVFAGTIPWMPRFAHVIAHRRVYGDPAKVSPAMVAGYVAGLNRASIQHLLAIVKTWWEDMDELAQRLPVRPAVLLIWGDQDRVVGLASAVRLREVLAARLEVVQGAGHLPFAEEPEQANRLMREWFTEPAAGAGPLRR